MGHVRHQVLQLIFVGIYQTYLDSPVVVRLLIVRGVISSASEKQNKTKQNKKRKKEKQVSSVLSPCIEPVVVVLEGRELRSVRRFPGHGQSVMGLYFYVLYLLPSGVTPRDQLTKLLWKLFFCHLLRRYCLSVSLRLLSCVCCLLSFAASFAATRVGAFLLRKHFCA